MMNNIYKRHITILTSVVATFIIVVVGLWKFEVLMQNKKVRVIEVRQELKAYEENKKIFEKESVEIHDISTRVSDLEKYQIKSSNTPDLLSNLESLAQAHGVGFVITSVETLNKGSELEKLIVSFSTDGTYTKITEFLKALSSQTYQTKIIDLSLYEDKTPVPEGQTAVSDKWQAMVDIEIISYSL